MQIPIVNGIYTDEAGDYRTSYPRNMVPVPKQNGISKGYLRPADGITHLCDGPGLDRGGIEWNNICYRVMGTKLVSIDALGAVTTIGDVGGSSQVSMDYSFDYLAIASNNNLFLYDGVTLQQVTDPDIGPVLDVAWIDGYFMTTDGKFLVVTDINNPFSVNPLKYGSSEVDPDDVKCLIKLRNEMYALNRHTSEVFDNIGGEGFPFAKIEGAQLQRGAIGTHAACVFVEAIAFVGSGRNEAPAVWLGANSQTRKISTREIDQLLLEYPESELETVVIESRVDKAHQHLYVHLPDKTLVYDAAASSSVEEPVWFILTSGLGDGSTYRGRNFVWCYDKWICGDPTQAQAGIVDNTISSHYGDPSSWEFGTVILYNSSMGAIVHDLELVALTGRIALGDDPTISTSYSLDGEVWSQDRYIKAGRIGDRLKRLRWLQMGGMRNFRIQRFRGNSDAHLSFARLEANVEPLNA